MLPVKCVAVAVAVAFVGAGRAHAQAMPDMPGMTMPSPGAGPATNPDARAEHDMATMPTGMEEHGMTGMRGMGVTPVTGLLGRYAMTRDASGTSWQPQSSPMEGISVPAGIWSLMLHGVVTLVHDVQGGPRGDTKTFSQSMIMAMASRPLGEAGTLGLRAMLSLDPLMGKSGYPLLFATGETANGREELVDRQHPHDFLMELAASYSHELGQGRSLYLYGGLPGEPALGPPTFMHRASAMDLPEAPIGHHWFDSTHITFGVITAGISSGPWKLEASGFNGREPDQHRWDLERPKLDSWSVRGFWNPTANLSLQLSTGHVRSPEQLHPESDEQRTTASVTYNLPLGRDGNWATTLAWARKDEQPGGARDGWLAETTFRFRARHSLFARAEHVDESELFDASPFASQIIAVSKLSGGYAYEVPLAYGPVQLALGGLASAYMYPERIRSAYGRRGIKSAMAFVRLRLAERSGHGP